MSLLTTVAAPLTWFPAAPLRSARSAAAAVGANGRILLLGGNPASDSVLVWGGANLTPLDTSRIAPGAVTLSNGWVVVYGGKETSGSGSGLRSAIIYDPSSGPDGEGPTNLASMATARWALGYAPDGAGGAYAIGGINNNQALASVERYDAAANSWVSRASLPTALCQFPAVYDGAGNIFTFGGRTNSPTGGTTAAVWRYNVASDAWSAVSSMPVATAASAAALGPEGKVYVVGGTSASGVTNLVQVYDPGADAWVIATPLPDPISSAMAAVDSSGRLVVMGGADINNANLATVWVSQRLNAPDAAPTFTSGYATMATYQTLYSSTPIASGNPQPTFLLLIGPAGMQIDPDSGLLTWTPQADQMGTNPVTVRATNYAGYADSSFIIKAVGPPPPAPTALVASDITETSVTLSWNASVPVIGPATYSVLVRHIIVQPKGGSRAVYVLLSGGFTNTTATIGGLAVRSSHTYMVSATAAGAASIANPTITITTYGPLSPTNVYVTGLTSTRISLGWDPSPGPVPIASYVISAYNSAYTLVARATGIAGTTGTVAGLAPGTQYFLNVQGYDAAGNLSPPVPSLTVITPRPVAVNSSPAGVLADDGFHINALGAAHQTAEVWASTNLADPAAWVLIASFLPADSAFSFTDTNASQFATRFYRIVQP